METYQDILTDIDERYTNTFTQPQKIRWLNQVQREMFRETALEGILHFKTVAGLAVYNEIQNIDFDLIESVTVNDIVYTFKRKGQKLDDYNYIKVNDDTIGLYPTPDSIMDVYVYYKRRPATITTENLTSTPVLKEDYIEILKYGVIIIMAKARGDVALANNYVMDYELALKEIKKAEENALPAYPTVKRIVKRRRAY